METIIYCVVLILGFVFASAFFLIVAAALFIHYQNRKYDHIPGPPRESFWFGNSPGLNSMKNQGKVLSHYFYENCIRYGPVTRISMGVVTFVLVTDPDAVKEILITGHYPKSEIVQTGFYKVFRQRFLGNGLLPISDPDIAAKRRQILMPWFQRSYLRKMLSDFNTCTDNFMTRLAEIADGKTKIKMLLEYNHITLDVLCKVGFGMEINSVNTPDNPFTNAIATAFKGASNFQMSPFMSLNPKNWKYIREVRKAIRFLRDFGKKTIEEREDAVKRGDYIPDDILTLLLKYKEDEPDFDVETLLDEFITFFIAGQETTASLLSFMMITLGQNPEAFKKLQKELDEVVGHKSVISYEDLGNLHYLDMVLKETLRLHPSVGGTVRDLTKDLVIGGYKCPAGTHIMISNYTLHHMEEYFDHPWEFRPERFSPENERVSTYTYLPFVIGARSCIGKNFAEIEAKIIMAKFVQRFEFDLDETQSFAGEDAITVKPKDGAMCYLRLRK